MNRAFRKAALMAAMGLASFAGGVVAQFPNPPLLGELEKRLIEPDTAFPGAAEIPSATLRLNGRKLFVGAEVHAAARVAVPLPGRLASWSPLTVRVNGIPSTALRRQDGSLWVALDEGVHRVEFEGLLADVTEWEWSFALRPKRVEVEAPGWTVTGIQPEGVPGQQVLFVRVREELPGVAGYEAQQLETVAAVERAVELGLTWEIQTTVRRLSPPGKGISLSIPLIEGEQVLTPGLRIVDGAVEVTLGAQQETFSWTSRMEPREAMELQTRKSDTWVERWSLVVSPVWNVALSGLAPVFQQDSEALVPTWNPWPGESVELLISRPEPVPGATLTVNRVSREIAAGKRIRDDTLTLSVVCSIGQDFPLTLPDGAEVTAFTLDGKSQPIRREGRLLTLNVPPGEHEIVASWKTEIPLSNVARAGEVALPLESANISTTLSLPGSRWVLWAGGPLRGPAVRFWTVLACSLIAAWILGHLKISPLTKWEWMLLALGLTQIPLLLAAIVVAWFFFLAWRGRPGFLGLPKLAFNLLQIVLAGVTVVALIILVAVVAEGLLGRPEMFIAGNGSTADTLRWFSPNAEGPLPAPYAVSVSIWFYRLAMLAWALWLAAALIRWLRWGWNQFLTGGLFHSNPQKSTPPPIPG